VHSMEVEHQAALCRWIEQALLHLWSTAVRKSRNNLLRVLQPVATGVQLAACVFINDLLSDVHGDLTEWKRGWSYYEREGRHLASAFNTQELGTLPRAVPERVPRPGIRRSVADRVATSGSCGGWGVNVEVVDGLCNYCICSVAGDELNQIL
jgi:hypothetical protein